MARFSRAGQIERVSIVKNSVGQSTGKAIIQYEDEDAAKAALDIFDDMAVDDEVNYVRPYYDDKTGEQNDRKQNNLL